MRNYGNKGLVVRGNVAAIDNAWLERFSLSLSHKMYLKKKGTWKTFLVAGEEKCRQSTSIHFQNEKLWEQGFGSRGEVAAIDSG